MQRRDVWIPPPKKTLNPYGPNPYIEIVQPYYYFHIPNSEYLQSNPPLFQVTYSFNSLGFRGPEISLRPPAGKKRLLVLGDSMTEGHGSELADAFPSLLNQRLPGWEVINGGLQGASPIVYALNIERYLNLNPDSMLVVLYENDILEDRGREVQYPKLPYLKTPDYLLAGVNRDGTPRRTSFWAESRLLRFIEQLIGRPLVTKAGVVPRKLIQLIRQNEERQRSLGGEDEQRRAAAIRSFLVAPSRLDDEWEMSAAYLDYFAEELRRRRVKLAVVWLSTNTRPTDPEEARRHGRRLNDKISAWASQRGIPFRSLMAPFLELSEAEAKQLIIQGDGHPTPRGHRFIAEQLEPWLRETVLR